MARKYQQERDVGSNILLVDDNLDYLESTKILLQHEGHKITTSPSGVEALRIAKSQSFDLILVDYYMPAMTGEDFIRELRTFNKFIHVILQTGYANEQSPRELLRKLDIQGYFDKSEGPSKLLLWVDISVKALKNIQMASNMMNGFDHILNTIPRFHQLPLDELLERVLHQVTGILGVTNSFLAFFTELRPSADKIIGHDDNSSRILMTDEKNGLMIQAGTGKFIQKKHIRSYLGISELDAVRQVLDTGMIVIRDGRTLFPLKTSDCDIGLIYLDKELSGEHNINLLNIFAHHAATAMHNSMMYQGLIDDPLASIFAEGLFSRCMLHKFHSGFRNNHSQVLMVVDMDNFKTINDQTNCLTGYQSLNFLYKCLLNTTRDTDVNESDSKNGPMNLPDKIEWKIIHAVHNNNKYPVINLPENKIYSIINRINTIMETEKLYRDTNLTLPDLAKLIGIKRNQLSYLLNKYLNTNFYDFINRFRVNEVIKILEQRSDNGLNLLSIGLDVGFSSKTAFNENFRKVTNMSPSEYRKKCNCSSA